MLFVLKMPENCPYVTKLATLLKMVEICTYPNNYHGLQPCKVGLISGRSTNQHVISEGASQGRKDVFGGTPMFSRSSTIQNDVYYFPWNPMTKTSYHAKCFSV